MKVIVVGAGIAGLSTAWSLTRRGHEVIVLEQGTIPNPLAASGDHHRIIRRAYDPGTGYAGMITEAYEAWAALWKDLGMQHYDARGFVCVSREEGDDTDAYRRGLEEGGWPFELVEPDEAALRWPFFEPGSFRYALHSREGGVLHCRKIASGMAQWLRGNGADLREETRAVALDADAGAVTLENGARLDADKIVVAAGAWVTKLLPELVADLTTYRTAVAYLDAPEDLADAWHEAPVVLDVGGKTDGYIIPPSGEGGLKFGSGLVKVENPDADADRVPRPGEGERIRDLFAPPLARLGEYRVREVVTCAYTFTHDRRFFASGKGKILVVSACSGHGYKFGAAVGRRVADAVEEGDLETLAAWLRARAA